MQEKEHELAAKMVAFFYDQLGSRGAILSMHHMLNEVILPLLNGTAEFQIEPIRQRRTVTQADLEQIAIHGIPRSIPSDQGQKMVGNWMSNVFDSDVIYDVVERNDRFAEEAIELTQSRGMTREEWHGLVDQIYDRQQPLGDPFQEVGGVLITLAALCNVAQINMSQAFFTELSRCVEKTEVIKRKQAMKRSQKAEYMNMQFKKNIASDLEEVMINSFLVEIRERIKKKISVDGIGPSGWENRQLDELWSELFVDMFKGDPVEIAVHCMKILFKTNELTVGLLKEDQPGTTAIMAATHRHVKRGSLYQLLGSINLQVVKPLTDDCTVLVYRAEDGTPWGREVGEFNDGRFENILAP